MGEHNTPEGNTPSWRSSRAAAAAVPLAGLVAVLAGCVVAWLNRDVGFWFAYAPLSNTTFSGSGAVFLSQGTQAGCAVAVAGLLVLAFWAGYRIGRRPAR